MRFVTMNSSVITFWSRYTGHDIPVDDISTAIKCTTWLTFMMKDDHMGSQGAS